MALERQNVSISFSKGLDTKTDPKQVVSGKLLLLQNATFQSSGRFKKRAGFGVLNSTLSAGNAIAAYNDELVVLDGSSVYSYGEQLHDLTSKGKKIACDISVDSIVRNSYQQTHPDSCILNGLMCFSYFDSSGKTLYSILDQVTKKVYVSGAQVGTNAFAAKVNAIGNYFVISYIEIGSPGILSAFTYNTLTQATSSFSIANCNTSSIYYDVSRVGSNLVYAYSGQSVSLGLPSCSMVSLSPTLVLGTPLDFYASMTYQKCIFDDGTGKAIVGFNTGTAVQYISCNSGLTSFTGPVNIETISNVTNLTGIYSPTGPLFFYEVLNLTGVIQVDNYVRTCQMVSGIGTPSDMLRSVGLWSKPFSYGGNIYLAVAHYSTLQSCYFVVDKTGSVVSRIATENGGGLSTNGVLREVNFITANQVQLAYLIKDFVSSLNGNVFTQTGVNSLNLTFGGPIITQNIGNNINLSGGVVSMYDGQNVVEKNFHLYPENVVATGYLFGGALKKGVYQYTETFQWTDNKGQIHESAIGVPVSVDFSNRVLYTQSDLISSYISADGVTHWYIRFTVGSGYYPDNVFVGMQVSGPTIPANTYITKIAYESGFYTAFVDNILSNSFVNTVTDIPNFKLTGSYSVNSSAINLDQVFEMNFTGDYSFGQNTITLNSVVGVQVGMTVVFGGRGFPQNCLIVGISGNVISFQNTITATQSATGQSIIIASYNASVLNGTNTITVSDALFTVPTFFIGQRVFGYRGLNWNDDFWFPANTYITGITYLSVSHRWVLTLNNAATSSLTVALFFGVSPTNYLYVGQTLAPSSGFNSTLTIKGVSDYSIVVDQVATSTGSGNFITSDVYSAKVTIPTCRVTEKSGISLVTYRTLVNQSIFYRTSSYSTPTINDKTIDKITVTDTVGDSSIIGNEQLYTTGDVVNNFPPPPSSISWAYKNRSMMVPSESTRQVWFSKPAVPGVAVEFSDQFIINVPEDGGAITAGAQLDDKNIIFKRGAIFAHVGDGPANTGAQNDFGDPQRVPSDSGCINQKSIVLIPSGLMFQSEKGIYLLDRSLSVTYIGHDVEAYNGYTISSAKLIRDLNQVRFSLVGSSATLVYDYLVQEWSVSTNPQVVDSTIYKNLYTYIGTTGKIYEETPGVFLDEAASILMGLTTSWLSFAGLQGFQRVREMLILGEYKSPHSLVLNIAYDFKSTYNQTVTIPVASAPVGAYQFRVHFKIQKCEAIQITLSETQSGSFGEGMSLSAFALEIGAKKGLQKVSAAQSYG